MPAFRQVNKSYSLNSQALSVRIIVSTAILILMVPLILWGWQIYRADRIARAERNLSHYTRAIQYDPSNALHWWHRGRLYRYSVQESDLSRAIQDYERALAINPLLGQAWLELSECYEQQRNFSGAEEAVQNALNIRRYSPSTHWQAGNFYLRRGNLDKMYRSFKLACKYDGEKLPIAIETAWKADSEHASILEKLIPDTLPANMTYMNFLVALDELDLARRAWLRCLQNEATEDFPYRTSLSFSAIDHLVAKNRVAEAQQLWEEALQKAGMAPSEIRPRAQNESGAPEAKATNLVWNGSFEREILQGGFDWRFRDVENVQFQPDLKTRMERLRSLRVTFTGSNLSLSDPHQYIPVPAPGNYQLEFYVRTENITTDQTPYLSIRGYPDAAGADMKKNPFPPSSDWIKQWSLFTVHEKCRAIVLSLRRDPSAKFDNQIKGSLWLDGISILPARPGIQDSGSRTQGIQ